MVNELFPSQSLKTKLKHIKKLIKIFTDKRLVHLHKNQTQKNARIQLIDECLRASLSDDTLINNVTTCINNYYNEKAANPTWTNSSNFENDLRRINQEILDYQKLIMYINDKRRKNNEAAQQLIKNKRNEVTYNEHMSRINKVSNKQAQSNMKRRLNELYKGGSKNDNSFINIKNVGQRKVREYKNGTKYVLIKNKEVTLDKF